jgi:adenine/guanine phosphoribosyltransferase-like PRPP-binding protein
VINNEGFLRTLRKDLLTSCFSEYEGRFHGGEIANNKLDLELLRFHAGLSSRVIKALGEVAADFSPAFITAVPEGANALGKDVARELSVPFIKLRKSRSAIGVVGFADARSRVRLLHSKDPGVLIEDVPNNLGSIINVLSMPEMQGKIVAVASVWDRGFGKEGRPDLRVPLTSLISEYIPPTLGAQDPLWQEASVTRK